MVFSNAFADCSSMLLNGAGMRPASVLNCATWPRTAAVACCSWEEFSATVASVLLIAVRSPVTVSIRRRDPSPSTAWWKGLNSASMVAPGTPICAPSREGASCFFPVLPGSLASLRSLLRAVSSRIDSISKRIGEVEAAAAFKASYFGLPTLSGRMRNFSSACLHAATNTRL